MASNPDCYVNILLVKRDFSIFLKKNKKEKNKTTEQIYTICTYKTTIQAQCLQILSLALQCLIRKKMLLPYLNEFITSKSLQRRRAWITRGGLLKLECKSHYWRASPSGSGSPAVLAWLARCYILSVLLIWFVWAYFSMLIRNETDGWLMDGLTDQL